MDVVSFDLFGTLVDKRPVDYFWLELIPGLYAEERGLELEEARREVFSKYEDVGESDLRWYLPSYWIEELGLKASLRELLAEIEPMMEAPIRAGRGRPGGAGRRRGRLRARVEPARPRASVGHHDPRY